MSRSISLRRSPKPGALTASTRDGALELVDDQGRERLAVDVLGDDEQRLAQLDGLLERREELLDARDLLVRDEDGRVLEDGLHAVRVGHEVLGDVAPVELHPLGVFLLEADRLTFLDGDDTVLADLVHDLGDELADLGIGGADGGHGRDLVARRTGREFFLSSATMASTPLSRPRLTIIGLAPAVTFLRPSVTSAWPSTTAVVVPSPATSSVLVATSLRSCAPMFSKAPRARSRGRWSRRRW